MRIVCLFIFICLFGACSLKEEQSPQKKQVLASDKQMQFNNFEKSYRRKLISLHKKYIKSKREKNIEQLVLMDQEIRDLLISINAYYKNIPPTSDCKLYHSPKNSVPMMIYGSHYACQLIYSGQLLKDAHQVNPHSKWRQYTLFSASDDYGEDLNWMPHLKEYAQYLKEFPQGPFAADILASKAYFYADLALVAYYRAFHNMSKGDYKYDCFEPYITSDSLPDQFKNAQKQAIHYLAQSIQLTRKKEILNKRISAMKEIQSRVFKPQEEIYGWHWCQD